jgi:hypothetical protein
MLTFTWTSGYGTAQCSVVSSRFTDNGISYVIVRIGRAAYDPNPPYAVMRQSDGILIHVDTAHIID